MNTFVIIGLIFSCSLSAILAGEVRLVELEPNEAAQYINSADQNLKYAPKIESNVPALRYLGKQQQQVSEDLYLANQYHGQDGLGAYVYGYSVPDIAKTEKKERSGDLRGAYNYIAGNGQEIKVQYWDDGTGFHQIDNVPREAPEDDPEVKAAKEEHLRIWQEQAIRNSQAPDPNEPYQQQQHDQTQYQYQSQTYGSGSSGYPSAAGSSHSASVHQTASAHAQPYGSSSGANNLDYSGQYSSNVQSSVPSPGAGAGGAQQHGSGAGVGGQHGVSGGAKIGEHHDASASIGANIQQGESGHHEASAGLAAGGQHGGGSGYSAGSQHVGASGYAAGGVGAGGQHGSAPGGGAASHPGGAGIAGIGAQHQGPGGVGVGASVSGPHGSSAGFGGGFGSGGSGAVAGAGAGHHNDEEQAWNAQGSAASASYQSSQKVYGGQSSGSGQQGGGYAGKNANQQQEEESGPPKGFFYSFDYPVGIIVGKNGQQNLEGAYSENKAFYEKKLQESASNTSPSKDYLPSH